MCYITIIKSNCKGKILGYSLNLHTTDSNKNWSQRTKQISTIKIGSARWTTESNSINRSHGVTIKRIVSTNEAVKSLTATSLYQQTWHTSRPQLSCLCSKPNNRHRYRKLIQYEILDSVIVRCNSFGEMDFSDSSFSQNINFDDWKQLLLAHETKSA